MVIRQNDNRRRRLVVDPSHPGSDLGEASPSKKSRQRKASLYKVGAERRHQWKTTDLLPKRAWALAVVIGLVLLSLIGLNLGFFYSRDWASYLGDSGVASLQLSGRTTLAAWFSSFLLIISGFASLQIYALRQHRQDDYRGSYRLWLWMALLLLVASVNCIVDLTDIGASLLHRLTHLPLKQSLVGVIAVKFILLSALVTRGSFEVRESRTSLMLVLLVWFAYGAAITLRLPLMQPLMANLDEPTQQLASGNLILLGAIFIFLAHLVFARFVYMQAIGLIKPKSAKAKRIKSTSQTKTAGSSKKTSTKTTKRKSEKTTFPQVDEDETAVDEPTATPSVTLGQDKRQPTAFPTKPSTRELASPTKSNSHAGNLKNNSSRRQEEDDDANDSDILKLSKSEQRRQRKLQQQPSHRRAA